MGVLSDVSGVLAHDGWSRCRRDSHDGSRCDRAAGASHLPCDRDDERRLPKRRAPASYGCRPVDAAHHRARLTRSMLLTLRTALARRPAHPSTAAGGEQLTCALALTQAN